VNWLPGYNVEYSGVGFALFFIGEYCNIILMSVLSVLIFFGGWLYPSGTFGTFLTFLFIPSIFFDVGMLANYAPALETFANNWSDFWNPIHRIIWPVIAPIWVLATIGNLIPLDSLVSLFYNIFLGFESAIFIVKVNLMLCFFIWVRSAVPRYRYDHLMRLGWQVFLPISIGYCMLVVGILLAFDAFPPPEL